ncbi:hypothetical protein GCM10028895_44100 [Pontibacter rugosus]
MEELIEYILQFGNLNGQQINLVKKMAIEVQLQKDAYFSEAAKIPSQVGFIVEGVIRGCYYNNKGEEITRCFVSENSLVVDYVNFEANTPLLNICKPVLLVSSLFFLNKTGKSFPILL